MKPLAQRLLATAAVAFTLASPLAYAQTPAKTADRWFIIQSGTLMADATKPIATKVSVIVKNDKIDSIKPGFVDSIPGVDSTTVHVVDLKDKFVMAGLIDAHVHIAGQNWVAALRTAREKVISGVTTARDAGSNPELIFPLRDSINQGLAYGPRILASGSPISTTGGHGDHRNGNFLESLEPPAFDSGICDGEDECRKVTRRQIQLGADQIKLIATAGVLDDSDTGLEQQFSLPEMKVIVESAHLMKRKVMAHAIGQEGIKAAVIAGVDSIEHGNYLDDEGAKMMAAKGVYLSATLTAPADVLKRALHPEPGARPLSKNTYNKIMRMPEAQPNGIGRQVRLATKYGVKLAVATDFGGTPSGEMVLLVHDGGIKPLEALKAATISNADLLGISDKVGTLEPGKSADIVAFTGSPIDDIENATKVTFVMSQGHEYKGPGFELP
ncbi:amidohydrolase family protein [Granulicella sp. WH15]|uniref:metal-dependent hydrolase family protein n=1 Tax=Granulicella sp. WH15 TaxID=2602070 RepID=UPI00136698D7|nr:amidohydrolase family protein [Granulicella sp. WH15]QHN02014.1 amidohydrolase family protein [Granulicella sp. WH15]